MPRRQFVPALLLAILAASALLRGSASPADRWSANDDPWLSRAMADARIAAAARREEPLWQPPRPAAGESFGRYLDHHTVVLDVEGRERGRLLRSTLPLRAPASDGEKRPVSIEFEDRGGFVSARNGLVRARLHKRLGDGLELPSSGVTVRAAGVDDPDAAAAVS